MEWKGSLNSFIVIFIAGTRDRGFRESGRKAMGAMLYGLFISHEPWAGSPWLFYWFGFELRQGERKW